MQQRLEEKRLAEEKELAEKKRQAEEKRRKEEEARKREEEAREAFHSSLKEGQPPHLYPPRAYACICPRLSWITSVSTFFQAIRLETRITFDLRSLP